MTARSDARFRVATLNCLHGVDVGAATRPAPAGASDLEALARSLERMDADVIALQEVDRHLRRSGGVDQSGWLARRLSMEHVFAPALLGDPDGTWTAAPARDPGGPSYGVALLSRHPILASYRLRLPGGPPAGRTRTRRSQSRPVIRATAALSDRMGIGGAPWPGWDFEPRVALRADVALSTGTVAVTTAHCSYLPWRALRHVAAAARLATRPSSPRNGRAVALLGAVLLGDMNLPPAAVRARLPRWHHGGSGPTYPSSDPRIQLDHVLATAGLVVAAADTAAATSDHLALVATVAGSDDGSRPR